MLKTIRKTMNNTMNNTMTSINFFKSLNSFDEKQALLFDQNYFELPEDWIVFITDVKGSTAAIEEGKYKEVNIAGVSSIVSVKNALNDFEFPFVFGGDGATLLIPEVHDQAVQKALSFCRTHIKNNFDLELRVGRVSYQELKRFGCKIEVAKMHLSEGNQIAMLRGDGLVRAEKMIKSDGKNLISNSIQQLGNHQGLECRWNPIPSIKGHFLSLIIQNRSSVDNQALNEILKFIFESTDNDRFLSFKKLPKTWPPAFLKQEMIAKYGIGIRSRVSFFFVLIITKIFASLIAKSKETDDSTAAKYMKQLIQNTDFLKVDDSLKIVIDTSKESGEKILKLLESKYHGGLIFYGSHFSKDAMMTCFVRSMTQHIHFIDGGSGGYAMAAKQLKQQRAEQEVALQSDRQTGSHRNF